MKPVFVDEADIIVESGSGGPGSVHFRRARFLPKGGPDGGDGGRGGHVILYAKENLADLSFFLHRKVFKAESGAPGGGNKQHGKNGADLRLAVPIGTQVFEGETHEVLADLDEPGAEVVVALGGRGGKGNVHYKSPVRQAPRIAQRGMPGKRVRLHLIYKLRADVALIGFPNVGKSLFLSRITSATPKVADYPYTTVVPQLGVYVSSEVSPPLTFVEIPGISVGASIKENRYLKHAERARLLLIFLETSEGKTEQSLLDDLDAVVSVLEAHGEVLAKKQKILGLTKMDVAGDRKSLSALCQALEQSTGVRTVAFSAKTGEGVEELLQVVAGSCTLSAL